MTALDPEGRERTRTDAEEPLDLPTLTQDDDQTTEPSAAHTLNASLDHRSLGTREEHGGGGQRDADPVWTRNAPDFLTADSEGTRGQTREPNATEKLSLKEKTENLRLYFGSLEDYERRKGGRTHYRIILSFDVPATNQQIRDLTNNFLEQTFPKAIAFGAIHRDTDHPHVHLYLNSRQTDGRRIQLKNNEFKTIDEKWARIYTEFAGDKSAYVEYLRKKEETRQWKIAAAEAYRKEQPIPPKPQRDNDRRERLAEQRMSAERSAVRDRGKQLESRPPAEPVSRAASEKETSRLLARNEVAREQLAHLIRTDAPETQIKSAARTVHDFSAALAKTLAERKELGRERLPQVVYTTEEWKQLKEYAASRELPVNDDHAAARLQAICVLAGAEMKDAQEKAEAFQVSRHLWKFDVQGWDRQLSLMDIEKEIAAKKEEKLKVYNFIRPNKREQIQGQVDYLHDVKKDIQNQLAAKELGIEKNVGAAEVRYQVTSALVNQAAKARANEGKPMPRPIHQDELARLDDIATRNKDADLLRYIYDHIKDKLLANPTPSALSRLRGVELLARKDRFVEADRLERAARYADYRQLPVKDTSGRDYTKSIREVAPRNAVVTIIRHFTDSVEQRRELKELGNSSVRQLARAQDRADKASDYAQVVGMILGDHLWAAGVSLPRDVKPTLNAQQIAELREFADREPFLSYRRPEFEHAARQAEELLQAREAAAARQAEQARPNDLGTRSRDQLSSQDQARIERSNRESYSRGR